MSEIKPWLRSGDYIIDIGCGTGTLTELLLRQGFKVLPVDVEDLSCVVEVRPLLASGSHMPFRNQSFDVALLSDVLHHTPCPRALIGEAARIAHRVIVHETVYGTQLQKYLTFAMDRVLSLNFGRHPHTNLPDAGWRALFTTLNLTLVDAQYSSFWFFFRTATYLLITQRCSNVC